MMLALKYLSPEIALVILACFSAIGALFTKHKIIVLRITLVLLIGLIFAVYNCSSCITGEAFEGSFVNNSYSILFKEVILIGAALILLSYIGHIHTIPKEMHAEFATLFLLSLVGSFISISARDLVVLFLGLELQSLPAYILASFSTGSAKSSEAGLKYFILGALSSAILLFGASFVYGTLQSVGYSQIAYALTHEPNIMTIVGISLVITSLMFKLSVVPFHMWTPDVYEGAPVMSVMIFSSVHKIASLAVFVCILTLAVDKFAYDFINIMKVLAVASLMVGSLGAIFQTSIKRLMAYSTILNIGYILLALIADISLGIWSNSFFIYIIIYAVSIIGLFAILASIFGKKADDLSLGDLAGLSKSHGISAFGVSLIMFSLIGIPPLAGFFGKYYVLLDLIKAKEYILVVFALLASLIAAYYYLKVIRSIYFDEAIIVTEKNRLSLELVFVGTICVIFLLFFIFGVAEYFINMNLSNI